MNEVEAAVAAQAERQYGLINRTQAATCGMSEYAMTRRVMNGDWITVFPGVYRLPGAPPSKRQTTMAATLWSGGTISHNTAGKLLRLDDVRRDGLHLIVDPKSGFEHPDLHIHRSSVPDIDKKFVDRIPCTSATRTVIDLAPYLDEEALEAAFESGRRMGLTTVTLLQRRAAELVGRGRPGSAQVRKLLSVVESRATESRLEVKLARLLRTSGLPKPVRQYRVGEYRLDLAWPWLWIAAECDGFERHGARLAWKRDRARVAAIEHAGWRIVHFTWDDITQRPAQSLDRVALALRAAA